MNLVKPFNATAIVLCRSIASVANPKLPEGEQPWIGGERLALLLDQLVAAREKDWGSRTAIAKQLGTSQGYISDLMNPASGRVAGHGLVEKARAKLKLHFRFFYDPGLVAPHYRNWPEELTEEDEPIMRPKTQAALDVFWLKNPITLGEKRHLETRLREGLYASAGPEAVMERLGELLSSYRDGPSS